MRFFLRWDVKARDMYDELRSRPEKSLLNRKISKKAKASREEGLFKQVRKCVQLLKSNPKHPGLATHQYSGLPNPHNPKQKVFEAYVQQSTPAAYRVFWCYGPEKDQITIVAITPHP
jgi:hypothetical protein